MIKFLQEGHKDFIKNNKIDKKYLNIKTKNKILVDFFDDYSVIFVFSAMKKYLQQKYNANFEYFSFNEWQNVQLSFKKGLVQNLKSLIRKFRTYKILKRLFSSFGVSQGVIINYNNFSFFEKAEKKASKIFNNLNSIDDVYKIKYKSINLGKYIYQSYLRDHNQPTIDLNDIRLREIIKKSFIIFFNVQEYFSKNNVKILIPSHTVYLYYGIITEYAFKRGCKVFRVKQSGFRDTTSTHLIRVDNKLSEAPPTHNYKKIFDNFSFKNKKLFRDIGRKHLLDRFKGKLELNLSGKNIIYHKNKKKLSFKRNRKKILLFLPCFFDGPGRHENLIFPDFYQWILFVLDHAKNTPFDWYIKPHPVGIKENDEIIKELKKNYLKNKNLIFISKQISNSFLINQNFQSLFCHHGNVVPEFAYQNIPVVVACNDFASSFDIAVRAKNKNHLKRLIIEADNIKFKSNKKNIYEFIYMHFIYFMGYIEDNRIFKNNLESKLKSFHDSHNANITHHKFFQLFSNKDYKYAEEKIKNLLKEMKI